ncbi:DoxX family protein [Aquimarina agarivorans]|uniref:DoxX family protein n=1 Tax=Aquimarina agarivorans TaxID=980584 RepID=UPI000248F88E|nr:DoxX family protein [Aquimarina agarivorans]
MEIFTYISIALKLIIGISILNVWLVQPKKATKWRGGNAENIVEEFEYYGLSKTVCYLIGFLKVSLSILLLVSIKLTDFTVIASSGLALLLLGSVLMHFKVKDPLYKSFPAALFIVLNLFVIGLAYM